MKPGLVRRDVFLVDNLMSLIRFELEEFIDIDSKLIEILKVGLV